MHLIQNMTLVFDIMFMVKPKCIKTPFNWVAYLLHAILNIIRVWIFYFQVVLQAIPKLFAFEWLLMGFRGWDYIQM